MYFFDTSSKYIINLSSGKNKKAFESNEIIMYFNIIMRVARSKSGIISGYCPDSSHFDTIICYV